jgi:hypothetical protein
VEVAKVCEVKQGQNRLTPMGQLLCDIVPLADDCPFDDGKP